MRWTAPMKSPSPPPPIPRRMRGSAIVCSCSGETQHPPCLRSVNRPAGEIVEGPVGDTNDVVADERRAFARAVFRILQAAFPLEHRPAVETDRSHLGEDRFEIDLPIAERTKAAGAIDPWLEARIDPLPSGRIELGILHMEGANALSIDVDKGEVIELLQNEVRGIIVDRTARVVAGTLEQHLEGDAVADVLAWMDLKTEIDASLVIGVQDRTPAAREFVESGLDHSGRPLRPRIEERPGQRARKADAAFEPEPAGRTGGFDELIDCPTLTFLRSAFDRWRREGVKGFVIGRMNGHP